MKAKLTVKSAFLVVLLYPVLGIAASLLARILFGGGAASPSDASIHQVIGTGMYGTIIVSIILLFVSIYVFSDSTRDIFFERRKFALSKLYYLFPLVWAGAAVVALLNVDFAAYSWGIVLRVIIAALAIAVSEEVVTRGILLVGLRNSRFVEWKAWLITLVVFSAYHLVNVVGGGNPVIVLVVVTGGTLLYVSRRVFGNLFVPIGLHGFYDTAFYLLTGSYAVGGSLPDKVLDIQLASFLVLLAASILFLIFGRHLFDSDTVGWT